MQNVTVDISQDLFIVLYDETRSSTDEMFAAVIALGYEPKILGSELPLVPGVSKLALPQEYKSLLGQRPIAVYFGATWCAACKIMERSTFTEDSVQIALERFSFRKIDIEKEPKTSEAFLIRGVPSIVILDSEGEEVYRHVGPLNSLQLTLILEQFDEI